MQIGNFDSCFAFALIFLIVNLTDLTWEVWLAKNLLHAAISASMLLPSKMSRNILMEALFKVYLEAYHIWNRYVNLITNLKFNNVFTALLEKIEAITYYQIDA